MKKLFIAAVLAILLGTVLYTGYYMVSSMIVGTMEMKKSLDYQAYQTKNLLKDLE